MGYLLMPRVVLVVGLLLLPLILDPYWQRVICSAGIYALLAIGFDFLAEYVGLVCLGGAFFIGAGGYIAGLLNEYFHWSPFVTIPIATLLGAGFSTLVLVPCLRLRGIYFAIVSFMFPLFAVYIIIALNVFGGTEGITALDTLPNAWIELYLILAAVIISLFALRRLVSEDMGIIMRGVMDNDQAVKASGINITSSLFAMDFSILPIAACVMGGMGTLVGPVLGAFILTPMSEALRGFGQLRVVLYCLILIGFMVYKPEGIMNYLQRKYHQFEVWEEV